MDVIIKQVKFEGDFSAFVEFLPSDERLYAKTLTALLKEASFIAKQMDAKLPALFKILPRPPYGVIKVPANMRPSILPAATPILLAVIRLVITG